MAKLRALGWLVLMGLGSVSLVGCGGPAAQSTQALSPAAPASPQWVQRVTLAPTLPRTASRRRAHKFWPGILKRGLRCSAGGKRPLGSLASQNGEASSDRFVSPELQKQRRVGSRAGCLGRQHWTRRLVQ